MTYQTLSGCFVISGNVIFREKCADDRQNLIIYFCTDRTGIGIDDRMGSAGIEADHDIAVFVSANRKLCFISIVVWFFHTIDWFHQSIGILNLADPAQTFSYFIPFVFQLLLIGNVLKTASTTALCDWADRSYAVRGWCDQANQPSVGDRFFCFHDRDLGYVTDHCIFDKYSDILHVISIFG